MSERDCLITHEGAQKLKRQLAELKGPKRRDIARRLRHAIQQGDLTENADYIATKEEQAFLEGKIQELEEILKNSTVVDKDPSSEIVSVGSTVAVFSDLNGEETFHIVGVKEADPKSMKISHESPIGMALIGKRIGEHAVAETPGGEIEFRIVAIR